MTGNFSTTGCDSSLRRNSGCDGIYLLCSSQLNASLIFGRRVFLHFPLTHQILVPLDYFAIAKGICKAIISISPASVVDVIHGHAGRKHPLLNIILIYQWRHKGNNPYINKWLYNKIANMQKLYLGQLHLKLRWSPWICSWKRQRNLTNLIFRNVYS